MRFKVIFSDRRIHSFLEDRYYYLIIMTTSSSEGAVGFHISWITKSYSELSVDELYKVLRLRSEVFVVEQKCIFLDIDGNDQMAHHCMGYIDGQLVAYTRLFDVNLIYEGYRCIGRVMTSLTQRRTGLGKKLIEYSISECIRLYGQGPIKIGAQYYLKNFYSTYGFIQCSDVYEEDGIDHIYMIKK